MEFKRSNSSLSRLNSVRRGTSGNGDGTSNNNSGGSGSGTITPRRNTHSLLSARCKSARGGVAASVAKSPAPLPLPPTSPRPTLNTLSSSLSETNITSTVDKNNSGGTTGNSVNDTNMTNAINNTPRRKSINYLSSPRKQLNNTTGSNNSSTTSNNLSSTFSHVGNGSDDVDSYRRNDSGKAFRRTQSSTFVNTTNTSPSADSKFKRTNSTSAVITKANTTTRSHNHHNHINIYVRVRAFLPTEIDGSKGELAVKMQDEIVQVDVPKRGKYTFQFDGCMWSNDRFECEGKKYITQADVFQEVGMPMVENALNGYSAAIIAYGQTGSGKTYTEFGPPDSLGTSEEGLVPRMCNKIFERAQNALKAGTKYSFTACMVEINRGVVYDLIDQKKKTLKIRQNIVSNTYELVNATWTDVKTYSDIDQLLRKAEPRRTYAKTNIHDHSSRAHTLFMLEISITRDDDQYVPRRGKLLLADLAGCERIKESGTDHGIRLEETKNINSELFALTMCINTLTRRKKNDDRPVLEFKNNPLTKLLKEYFGGNSKSTMIVTISPSRYDAHITEQTLKCADNAKHVTNNARINFVTQPQNIPEGNEWPEELQREYEEKRAALYDIYQLYFTIEKNENKIVKLQLSERSCENDEQASIYSSEIDEIIGVNEELLRELDLKKEILYGEYMGVMEENTRLEREIQNLKDEQSETIEKLAGENAGLIDALKRNYEDKIRTLKIELSAENDSLKEENKKLQERIVQLENKLKNETAEKNELKKQAVQTALEYKQNEELLESKIANLQKELENLQKEMKDTTDSKKAEVHNLNNNIIELEKNYTGKEKQWKAAEKLLTSQLEEVKKTADDRETELSMALIELQEEVKENKEETKNLLNIIRQAEDDLQETSDKLNATEEELQQTNDKLNATEEELHQTNDNLQQLDIKFIDLCKAHELSLNDIKELNLDVESVEQELAESNYELECLNMLICKYHSVLDSVTNNSLDKLSEFNRVGVDCLSEFFSSSIAEICTKSSNEYKKLESELEKSDEAANKFRSLVKEFCHEVVEKSSVLEENASINNELSESKRSTLSQDSFISKIPPVYDKENSPMFNENSRGRTFTHRLGDISNTSSARAKRLSRQYSMLNEN